MMTATSLHPVITLRQLLDGYAEVSPQQDCEVQGMSLDSRKIGAGDLFFALGGSQSRGQDFIQDAVARGAVAILTDSACEADAAIGVPCIAVAGLRDKMGAIASRFYRAPSEHMSVIGITGTNGKTSVSRFLAQALTVDAPAAVIGTLGNGLLGQEQPATHTTPDAISLQDMLAQIASQGAAVVAMEVSSHGLDQGRVNGMSFETAVFTNLSRDHLDYHGDMASYAAAKARLFQWQGLLQAVINLDDAYGEQLLQSLSPEVEAVAYGLNRHEGVSGQWLWATQIEAVAEGFDVSVDSSWGSGRFHLNLLGRFNISNALAVLATLLVRGITLQDALQRMSHLSPVPGRMQAHGGGEQPLVVVDYAHTPDALQQVLSSLRPHCKGRLFVVFGCGGDRDQGKRAEMGRIAKSCADVVVITNDNPRSEAPESIAEAILEGSGRVGVEVQLDRHLAIAGSIHQAQAGDVVLVAGKGHEDYQLIGAERLHFDDGEEVEQILAQGQEG